MFFHYIGKVNLNTTNNKAYSVTMDYVSTPYIYRVFLVSINTLRYS